jgi:hypothetical protein
LSDTVNLEQVKVEEGELSNDEANMQDTSKTYEYLFPSQSPLSPEIPKDIDSNRNIAQ